MDIEFGYLHFAAPELRADKELMLKIVGRNGNALEYLDNGLKSDKDIVLAAVIEHNYAIRYANPILQVDIDIITAALKNGDSSRFLIDSSLRGNKDVMIMAMNYDYSGGCYSLVYADDNLKKDAEFVAAAIKRNISGFQHPVPIF